MLVSFPHADGGFNPFALDDPPPLTRGADRYPAELQLTPPVSGMLFLDHLPHLKAGQLGYAVGLRWIREHPGTWLRLAGRQLAITWSGAGLGFGGHGLPLGRSGRQRVIDLVRPRAGCSRGFRSAGARRGMEPRSAGGSAGPAVPCC